MTTNHDPVQSQRRWWRVPGLIVVLAVVACLTIVVAYVIPMIPWASNGDIRFPVRVFVFDAAQRTPIRDAIVAVFPSPPVLGPNSLAQEDRRYRADEAWPVQDVVRGQTGSDGMAVVEFRFKTSANNRRPEPEAHTRWAWVEVHAEGYGTVVVPVRHDFMKTADMRKLGELLVPMGLVALNQSPETNPEKSE